VTKRGLINIYKDFPSFHQVQYALTTYCLLKPELVVVERMMDFTASLKRKHHLILELTPDPK